MGLRNLSRGAAAPKGVPADPDAAAPAGPRARMRTFASLSERDYAWYFTGNIAFFMAMQMQMILQGYLAFDLTDSAAALGLISITMAGPMLLVAPVGGVITDWFNKRTLLIFAQSGVAAVTLVVTILIISDVIAFWHLMVTGVVTACIMAVAMPARQALVPQLVPQQKMMNAVSLQMGSMNLTRIIGPALGAGLIAVFDVGWAYAVTVGLFGLGVMTMFPLPKTGMVGRERGALPRSFRGDLLGGFSFVAREPLFRMLLLTALLMPLFVFPVQQILPVFASEVFEWDDIGLGILAASTGVGGLAGTLLAANFDYVEHKGRMMLGGALLMAVAIFTFALMPIIWFAAVLLAIGNLGSMLFMTTNNTVIQAKVPDEYRGRVMSMLMMSFGLSPLGVVPVTVAADIVGAPAAVAGAAVVLLIIVVLAFTFSERLRNLRVSALEDAEMSPAQAAKLVAEGKITREEADRLSGRSRATGGAPGGG